VKKTWTPAILAGILLLVEMALNIFGSNIHVALWLAVLLLVVQIVILQRELVEIKNQNPHVIFDSFKLERVVYKYQQTLIIQDNSV
jgi:hypothetical protein